MDLGLEDKVIVIAGGSRGIGLGIAESCLKEGARVALVARGQSRLEAECERLTGEYGPGRIWIAAADMRNSAEVDSVFSDIEGDLGPLTGVVANVGIDTAPAGFDLDDKSWAEGLSQNLDTAFYTARSGLKRLESQPNGSLLLISSIAGIAALGSPLTYGTSKAAINHLCKELSRLTGPSGTRVNAIAPGNILFDGGTWQEHLSGPRKEVWENWIKREVSLKRFGTPAEIGDVAAFLLSPRSSFMTGSIITVDGGQLR